MQKLWLYGAISKLGVLNYRAKVMFMAFLGTHIPLIAIIVYYVSQNAPDWQTALVTIGVALVATLVGTGITLFVLNHLLRPVLMTAKALRQYRATRQIDPLPTGFTDEVGTLMADAAQTLEHLEGALTTLEFGDLVTGLPNRQKFLHLLAGHAAATPNFAVCALRLKNYAQLIGAYEQKLVDQVIKSMAERLSTKAPALLHLSRVDAQTFVFVLDGAGKDLVAQAQGQLSALLDELADAIVLGTGTVRPNVKGGASFAPDDGVSAEVLLDQAVGAAALASEDRTVAFHSPKAREAARERIHLEQELRRALDKNEFALHFQPVVDLAAGQTVGAEALIRWNHAERGLLLPGAFIPTAESSGMIEAMGLWVMRNACMQVRQWENSGLMGMRVAVNLSARQFLDPHLTEVVTEALQESRLPANQLEIELTETTAMADYDHSRKAFFKLRDLGVSIAIDDFGTGYASMSYLRKLPFDKLKIDREFVTNVQANPQSQAICNALIALSKGLDLKVLAEGTETLAEVQYLSSRGCDLFQGYFFSRPVEGPAFPEIVADLAAKGQAPASFYHAAVA